MTAGAGSGVDQLAPLEAVEFQYDDGGRIFLQRIGSWLHLHFVSYFSIQKYNTVIIQQLYVKYRMLSFWFIWKGVAGNYVTPAAQAALVARG